MRNENVFMEGNWEDLIISTFEVDKQVLQKYLPTGVELHLFNGKALMSMVAFTFSKVKFSRIKVPFHQMFGEINFRFYVKSQKDGSKGVVFIKEYARKPLIAIVARKIYNEPFFAKNIGRSKSIEEGNVQMKYTFPNGNIQVEAENESKEIKKNTLEYFIVDRYLAFVKSRSYGTYQYKINHRPWKIKSIKSMKTEGEVLDLLPREFHNANLITTYFVDGSPISVEKGILEHERDKNIVVHREKVFLH